MRPDIFKSLIKSEGEKLTKENKKPESPPITEKTIEEFRKEGSL